MKLLLRFHNYSESGFSVYSNLQRVVETHYSHKVGFCNGRHIIKVVDIANATLLVVDGEITHTERCQILEEVSALARLDALVGECGFGNYPCCRDVSPFHGDTQSGVA